MSEITEYRTYKVGREVLGVEYKQLVAGKVKLIRFPFRNSVENEVRVKANRSHGLYYAKLINEMIALAEKDSGKISTTKCRVYVNTSIPKVRLCAEAASKTNKPSFRFYLKIDRPNSLSDELGSIPLTHDISSILKSVNRCSKYVANQVLPKSFKNGFERIDVTESDVKCWIDTLLEYCNRNQSGRYVYDGNRISECRLYNHGKNFSVPYPGITARVEVIYGVKVLKICALLNSVLIDGKKASKTLTIRNYDKLCASWPELLV